MRLEKMTRSILVSENISELGGVVGAVPFPVVRAERPSYPKGITSYIKTSNMLSVLTKSEKKV